MLFNYFSSEEKNLYSSIYLLVKDEEYLSTFLENIIFLVSWPYLLFLFLYKEKY